jgi:integrase
MHACYNDLNFEDNTITVKENLELGFKPKDREERIPLPESLMELLAARREMRPKDWLIFPTNQMDISCGG